MHPLKEYREKNNLSYAYCGDQLGLTRQAVYNIENNLSMPGTIVVLKMIVDLKINAKDLLKWYKENPSKK